jgi:outer membrane murein-binding lipoprotein Lpp
MTAEELASVTLEHLRHIRARVDQIADDVTDLKLRMSGLEGAMVLVKREVSHGDETDARQQITLDRLAARIERIERRLELSDPPH